MLRVQPIGGYAAVPVLCFASTAFAAPLTASGLDALQQYVDCREQCELGKLATRTECFSGCGTPAAAWNKDLDSVVGSRHDYQLALLEFADNGQLKQICYSGGAVIPKGQCGASDCLTDHTAAECTDADNDGLKAWQETLAGTSSSVAQRLCSTGADCVGFSEQCRYEPLLDHSYCAARATPTAFSLNLVEENALEVVVQVVFDYSPVLPTIIDVYVQFDGAALVLTESRGLSAATEKGKGVETRQVSDNMLRVIAIGAGDAQVIQPGPIAELVFRRKLGTTNSIGFSTLPEHREKCMAPSLGAQQSLLQSDSAWGAAVNLNSTSDATQGHVLLHYDFESERNPLGFSTAKSAAAACDLLRIASGQSSLNGNCPVEPAIPAGGTGDPTYAAAKLKRDRWIAQLSALQAGTSVTTQQLPGVTGVANWFDGRNDHLELPLTFNTAQSGSAFTAASQSFSVSFWMFRADATGEQILFSRATQSAELTQFALLSRPTADSPEEFDLVWLNGSIADSAAVRTVIAEQIPNRKWVHVGLSVDAATQKASIYLDGVLQRVVTVDASSLVTCPQIDPAANTRLTIHQEGDFATVRGTGPENIYVGAMGANGLSGVDVIDSNGLGRKPLVRLLDASAGEPDYNPYVDRIVYVSNEDGNSEIWLAKGDGSQRQRLTSGFGSTADGVFARRPRWAPDGSGIVFESNARSVDYLDNLDGLGYQLYYIGYDPQKNEPAIAGPSGSILQELNYEERLSAGDIAGYRLTRATDAKTNSNPQWLSGSQGTAELAKGELVYTASDSDGDNPVGKRVRIAQTIGIGADAAKTILPFVANEALLTNRAVLAARAVRIVGQPVVERALLGEQKVELVAAPEFTASIAAGGTCTSGSSYMASIRYSNPSPASTCWDSNRNQVCDGSTEDMNKDGQCTVLDCNAAGFEGLTIGYDRTLVKPNVPAVQAGSFLTTNNKTFRVSQAFGTSIDSVRLEVTSPINSVPIPDGTEVATIQFCGSQSPTLTFKRQRISQLFSVLTSDAGAGTTSLDPFTLDDSRIQSVTVAEFAPDAKRLALSVIFDARPTLLRTQDLTGTAGSVLLTTEPVHLDGMSWAGAERLFPCNWMGAVRNPTTKLYQGAFQGAFDEIKLVDYARSEAAYASEAARGTERLELEGRDGVQTAPGVACNVDANCATHQLCQAGTCTTVTCTPTSTYPCARGRCQKLPVEVSTTQVFACVAECLSDSTCAEKQCANGPCRFCDSTAKTCSECRQVVENVGGLTLSYIQGCPDRNSFACDRGTCVSDCYSFENGQSKYLCDPTLEYCRAGKCTLFDWNWSDVSPMSLVGAGEMRAHGVAATTAVSQLYPIEVTALGVADHAHPPEILVEGKVSTVFGGDWFDIGRIVVDNETRVEAENKPYIINSPYPVTRLRLRTILPPYENLTNSAMGLTSGRSSEFCTPASSAACRFTAQGSRAMLGYEAWIPGFIAKCAKEPGGCDSNQLRYLRSGTPIALVLAVKIKNQDQAKSLWINQLCPYWNGTAAVPDPVTATGVPNLIIYGDAAKELSNQKAKYYPSATATALQSASAATNGFGVLNCNYVDDTGSTLAAAAIEIPISNVVYPNPGTQALPLVAGNIRETANGCTVDMGTPQAARYEACFEWGNMQVSFDPFISEPQPYRTLTIDDFTSFGWGNPPDDNTP